MITVRGTCRELPEDLDEAARSVFPGPDYRHWLRWFHDQVRPTYYCEIGTASGESLGFVLPDTFAIAIDPKYRITSSVSGWCRLVRLPSDNFFSSSQATTIFSSARLDLSFIDGLHTCDQALRDFCNIERRSHQHALVLFHDVFPFCEAVATRRRNTLFWTGDVFKSMLVLSELRPDLRIGIIPCYPSGIAIVTNLNSESRADWELYSSALTKWIEEPFDAALACLKQNIPFLKNDVVDVDLFLKDRKRETTAPLHLMDL